MGRTVIFEETVKEIVDELIKEKTYKLGLVLGQNRHLEDKDHVIHLAATPLDSLEDVPDGKTSEPKKRTRALEDWATYIVTEHAIQLTRMLLGGFDVLGIFACTPHDIITPAELAHIRRLLSAIHTSLSEGNLYVNFESTERLFIHLTCVPNKINTKTLNITSSLASPRPVEFKFLTNSTKWVRLNCQLAIDYYIPQIKENSQTTLVHQFKDALRPLCEQIKRSVATFDGLLKSEDDLLGPEIVSPKKSKRAGIKKRVTIEEEEDSEQISINVNLYVDTEGATPNVVQQTCDVAMKLNGTISGRSYALGKCTVKEALKYLKFDLLRSLVARCDIHCEDLLVIEEEQKDRVVVHELPQRIFAPFSCLELSFSDYIFPGETANNSLDAIKELLNLTPDVENIEDTCEYFPDSSDLTFSALEVEDQGVPVGEMLPVKPPKSCNFICLGLSIIVGIAAAGASFYFVAS